MKFMLFNISVYLLNKMVPRVSVIGSGFSGLSAACFAAKEGCHVTVFEKNSTLGGRARSYTEQGFMFDMGPSWYWMPDVFENFFAQFGKSAANYYNLVQLDPGFQVFFGKGDVINVSADEDARYALFEHIEKGSAAKLKKFLHEAQYKYDVAMREMIFKPALSWTEFANYDFLKGTLRMQVFTSMRQHVRSYFKDPRLVALMEFPVLFLGAMPGQIPALYSLMSYAALSLGTWYPMGGMYQIIDAMHTLAVSLGVEFQTDCAVHKIMTTGNRATGINTAKGDFKTDAVIASADYHHVEEKLLDKKQRNYTEKYWDTKTFAPSCLIYYVGVNKRIKNLIHHNLFFDVDFEKHAKEIYENPKWPDEPLFYVCAPSKTDATVAPEGMENLFILIPIAPGLEDNETYREQYFEKVIHRMEAICDDSILPHIIYKKSYSVNDFKTDYNAYKGNAYGLANTLKQTAILKPSIQNNKVKNLFYTGQLTVPGPGVPPALISGQIAAGQLNNYLKKHYHESVV